VYAPFATVGTTNGQLKPPWIDIVRQTAPAPGESVITTAEYSPNPVPLTVRVLPATGLELEREIVGPIE
jgi:hypothetical protein